MRENDRKRSGAFAAFVNEVDADPIDRGFEVCELIDRGFVLPPVVGVLPTGHQLAEVIEIGAGIPVCAVQLAGPARVYQPPAQVAERLDSNVDSEFLDLIVLHDIGLVKCLIVDRELNNCLASAAVPVLQELFRIACALSHQDSPDAGEKCVPSQSLQPVD